MTTSQKAFVERTLLGLVFDLSVAAESVNEIKTKIFVLAKEHGLKTPPMSLAPAHGIAASYPPVD